MITACARYQVLEIGNDPIIASMYREEAEMIPHHYDQRPNLVLNTGAIQMTVLQLKAG